MPDHALELSFDEPSTAAVVAQWEALKEAGIPSQADHRSMTNAPHLTLVAAVGISVSMVPIAQEVVGPLLPARIGVRGLVFFGNGPRVTIAHLGEPDQALAAAVSGLRGLQPGLRHPVWTPHVTLARRVPRRLLPAAIEVLGSVPCPDHLGADRLRWWDPDLQVVEDVAIAGRA